MRTLLYGSAASILLVSLAFAQATAPNTATGAPSSPTPANMHDDGGKATASGDNNQTVATTNANADQPAKGANSFTESEARRRLEARGFTNVSNLAKDEDGIWRGKAQKDGTSTNIWVDYKGNVGQQS